MTAIAAITACWGATAVCRQDAGVILDRVRGYLARYDRELVTLVGDERYVQSALHSSRVLDSEFAWVNIPSLGETIGVREVLRVAGQPVNDQPRLRRLLENPPADPHRDFTAILSESATHNIGDVERNVNFPTFALAYLRAANDGGTLWRIEIAGDRAELRFEERGRATVIRAARGWRSPARGSFVVEAETGRILSSSLTVPVTTGGSKREYRLDVDFAEDERLRVWVPVRMRERSTSSDGLIEIAGEATYTNYRRFETHGRVVR